MYKIRKSNYHNSLSPNHTVSGEESICDVRLDRKVDVLGNMTGWVCVFLAQPRTNNTYNIA